MAHNAQARREAAAFPVVMFGPYGRTVEGYKPTPDDLAVASPASANGTLRHVQGPHLRAVRSNYTRNRTGIVGISIGRDRARRRTYFYVNLGSSSRKFCIDTLGKSEALRRAMALRREHLEKIAAANAAILAARAQATAGKGGAA